MENLFADLIEWMTGVTPLWAYLMIFVIAYGENVVPPIPGDLIVVFGGYLVGLGKLNFFLVVLMASVGGTVGFMTMYAVGAHVGRAILNPDRFRWLPKQYIFKAQEWLRQWGYGVVAANRFLSGARSVISLTVGMSHMSAWRTTAYATLSSVLWTALITYAGYIVGDNWEVVSVYLRRYGEVILALIIIFIVIQIVRAVRARRKPAADNLADSVNVEEWESSDRVDKLKRDF
jgi:membrane protein DedA with SNARE-associated domain